MFIKRIRIKNYKSIAAADVRLERLMFLLGRNGSGKSNFLDALRFVSDAVKNNLDIALRERGTIKEVRRRSGGHPNHFSIRLDFELPAGEVGHYSFRIGARPGGAFSVQDEECRIIKQAVEAEASFFRTRAGILEAWSLNEMAPAVVNDRLYLVALSGNPNFRPLFDALSRIEVYNLNPQEISAMQKPDPGDILRRDGSNSASILQNLDDSTRNVINKHLQKIVPGISGVEAKTLGSQETIEFKQAVKGQKNKWRFLASAMSDGTLRVLGVLLAIFQAHSKHEGSYPPLLIGLEEPEIALHPAAASVLLGALREGSRVCQILVTSHSPDLLDNPDISSDALLAVDSIDGMTRIGPLDSAGRDSLREKLFTAGELLRLDQVASDENVIFDVMREVQLELFEVR